MTRFLHNVPHPESCMIYDGNQIGIEPNPLIVDTVCVLRATADPPRYIDAKGTDFDVYFLDGSRITLKLVPATTAGQACVQIRNQVGPPPFCDASVL